VKNQYVGDINDYRKYGLLRAMHDSTRLQVLVAWMLTPDDGSGEGNLTAYLDRPARWRHHDPALFDGIRSLMGSGGQRGVRLIEESGLLPGAKFHSRMVPDQATKRQAWFTSLRGPADGAELVFLDPDNGIEVPSQPFGRRRSSKYVYWREIEALWDAGSSLLIYQHFIRQNRPEFIGRMLVALRARTPSSAVEAFSTAHVVFLMAWQPRHLEYHPAVVARIRERWHGQIAHRNGA